MQFSDDPPVVAMISRAQKTSLDDHPLCVITLVDLVRSKLWVATEPMRRRSKSTQDLADVISVVKEHPEIAANLTDDERRIFETPGPRR